MSTNQWIGTMTLTGLAYVCMIAVSGVKRTIPLIYRQRVQCANGWLADVVGTMKLYTHRKKYYNNIGAYR